MLRNPTGSLETYQTIIQLEHRDRVTFLKVTAHAKHYQIGFRTHGLPCQSCRSMVSPTSLAKIPHVLGDHTLEVTLEFPAI